MDDFERELKLGFLEEAIQLINDGEQCLLVLESNPKDMPTIEKIFRIAHSIKGSSKAAGFIDLSTFTHEFESFLSKCKAGTIPIYTNTISLLLKCLDHVKQHIDCLKADLSASLDSASMIFEIQNFQPEEVIEAPSEELIDEGLQEGSEEVSEFVANEGSEDASTEVQQAEAGPSVGESDEVEFLNDSLSAPVQSINEVSSQVPQGAKAPVDDFEIEILNDPTDLVSGIEKGKSVGTPDLSVSPSVAPKGESPVESPPPVQSGGHCSPALASPAPASPPPEMRNKESSPSGKSSPVDETIRVSLSRLERLLNFVGELVIMQTVLREQAYNSNTQVLRKTIHQMGKITQEVQDLSMNLRMVTLKPTFQKMQRIVRDTASLLGKKVNLVLQGEDTEVDKTVLEALSDPLVHLIRNAVDHGIESPADRIKNGKPEAGQVQLKAYHEGGKLIIEVKDNGGGISAERIRQKAVEKGILKRGQIVSDKEAINFIFHPGFSTKTEVSEVSGRGVGMDVVKTNIEQMQGEVTVDTILNEGSTFKIILPLTLAIIDGMIVKSGADRYVIPLSHVHESVKTTPEDLKFATGVGEILLLRGENLPVIRLSNILGKKKTSIASGEQIAIIIRTQDRPFATLVDDILGQYQVVIKKLGAEIQNVRGFGGSAILGDGKPALILELGDLIKSNLSSSSSLQRKQGIA